MCLKVGAVGFKSVIGSYRTDSKESPSFLLEERKVLVDSLHLVNWRFKIKQPSYDEHLEGGGGYRNYVLMIFLNAFGLSRKSLFELC